MSIKWNKVTWYSKLGALIVFVITVSLGFYLWNEYQNIQAINNSGENQQDENLYRVSLTLTPAVSGDTVISTFPEAWEPRVMGNYLAYILGLGSLDPVYDSFKDSISLIAYDSIDGSLGLSIYFKEGNIFNRVYYIVLKPGVKSIDTEKTYNKDGVVGIISKADPKLLPFIKDQSYCEENVDCTVGRNFCSYGSHNKFRVYIADIYGCEAPQYTQEDAYELEDLCDPDKERPKVRYNGSLCINNKCVAQNRTFSCEEGRLP